MLSQYTVLLSISMFLCGYLFSPRRHRENMVLEHFKHIFILYYFAQLKNIRRFVPTKKENYEF